MGRTFLECKHKPCRGRVKRPWATSLESWRDRLVLSGEGAHLAATQRAKDDAARNCGKPNSDRGGGGLGRLRIVNRRTRGLGPQRSPSRQRRCDRSLTRPTCVETGSVSG